MQIREIEEIAALVHPEPDEEMGIVLPKGTSVDGPPGGLGCGARGASCGG